MKTVPCRGCGKPMWWVTMAASGKKNPLDPDPTPDGNILITGDEATVLKGEALGQARKDGLDLYLSHFATCPQRMSFKK